MYFSRSGLSRVFLAFVVGLAFAQSPAATINVFLIGGQSNAAGMVVAEDIPAGPVDFKAPQEDVLYITNDKQGLGLNNPPTHLHGNIR